MKTKTIPRIAVTLLIQIMASTAWAGDVNITADGQTISDATTWKNGVVSITGNSTVTFSERITISGTVTLNLGEGTTLTAPKGIEVDKGNTLTIEGNGALNATADKFYAAIGRGFHDSTSGTSGTININGGTVTAIGGRFAAAIGGGYEGVSGTINISGGTIVATGGYCAAGIGGGTFAACGVVNISGGQVTANGDRASGIGPGFDAGTSGTVTLGWTTESDGILASNYNDVETLRVADGKAFTASTGNIYIGTLDDDQRAEFAGKTLKPVVCTGISLTKESQGLTATIDGTSTATINIPTAVTVDNVTYNRTFTVGKPVTIMLPFNFKRDRITLAGSNENPSGKFYDFKGIDNSGNPIMDEGNEVAENTLQANHPYLYVPGESTEHWAMYVSDGISIFTQDNGGGTKVTEYDGYELHGTYTEKVWEENDPEIGKAHVYNDNGELTAVTAGTKIRPTECYILKTKTRMTDMGITVTIPSQEWTGSELTPVITVKDGETTLTPTTDYTVTAPTDKLQNTGDYTVTINGAGNYAGSITAEFTIVPKVTTYGALTTSEDQSGKVATIDGTSIGTVEITDDPAVDAVILNRKFSKDKASTIMLPFDYTCNEADGGVFYDFAGVEKNKETKTNQWVATMTKVDKLTANTPYLFMPEKDIDGISFTLSEKVILNTTKGGECQKADKGSNWTFKGTYSYVKWTTDSSDDGYSAEHAAEIGRAYGFAGVEKTGIEVGDFVKVAEGAKIRPMSCYLLWSDTPNNARTLTRGAATEDELPQHIVVKLVGANGETTSIGTLDTTTGEVSFDGWYTLDGVKLNEKPSTKGIYINNGKKIVIK